MRELPSITVVIPTLNASRHIEGGLESIFCQRYPQSLLKVFIVDGGSTDDTLKIARSYDVEILFNEMQEAEIGKMIGFRKANSDLFLYLDADIELACDDWFKRMVFPFQDDSSITASFTRFLPRKSDPPLNRYLAYHKLMLDPVLRFFCPSIESTVVEHRKDYQVCLFEPWKIPPAGVQLYKLDSLKHIIRANDRKWWDIDIPVRLAKHGYMKFAYVENAGLYHLTVQRFRDLIVKKKWMITKSLLPNLQIRQYRYLDFGSKRSILKLLCWVLYANFFLPAFIKGIVQSLRNRDLACTYHPLITMFLTDYYIYHFLKNREGRSLMKKSASPKTYRDGRIY